MSNPAIRQTENPIKTKGDVANLFAILLDYRISINHEYDKLSKTNFKLMQAIENILTAACKSFNLPPCKVECVDYDTVRFKKFKSEEYSYVTESFINNCCPEIKGEFDKAKEPLKIYNESADEYIGLCEDCFFSMYAAICKTCFLIINIEKKVSFEEVINYLNSQYKNNEPEVAMRNTCDHFVFYSSKLLPNLELSEKVYKELIDFLMETQDNPKKVSLFSYLIEFHGHLLDIIDNVVYKLYTYYVNFFDDKMDLFELTQSHLIDMGYQQITLDRVKQLMKKY